MAGGPARFTRDFSGPVILGNHDPESLPYVYGGITLYARPFKSFDLSNDF